MKKTQIIKKVGKIAATVLLYLFMALCILSVVITIASKKDADGTISVLGIQMRIVLSQSMEKYEAMDLSAYDIKDIPMGSVVFIETVPDDDEEAKQWYSELEVGDVLTFKYVYVKQETITHRITGIRETGDGDYIFTLEGDNKDSDGKTLSQTIDTGKKNSPNYVVGKVTGVSLVLGTLLRFLKSPVGLVFAVIVPCMFILVFEILRVIRILGDGKRQKEIEQNKLRDQELDDLRKRLAELEAKK